MMDNLSLTTRAVLELGDLQNLADTVSANHLHQAVIELDGLILSATRRAAYIEARLYGSTHQSATEVSNARVKAVRKALGYTRP